MKIMIAIPALDYIHYRFVQSLVALEKRLQERGIEYDVVFQGGTLVYLARDELVKKAIFKPYKYVLWLDADMIFTPDLFDTLEAVGASFVTGIYRGRHGGNRPCVFDDLEKNHRIDPYPENEVFSIKGCGMGCCLTANELLKDIFMEYGTCFTPTLKLGEDTAFCKRVDDYGYAMRCEPKAKCAHILQEELWPDNTRKAI